jgi:hypothetical protein
MTRRETMTKRVITAFGRMFVLQVIAAFGLGAAT